MIKNICKINFRSLDCGDLNFTEMPIAHADNTLEISDEDTSAGKLYNHTLRAVLQKAAFFRSDGLQFDVYLSDGTHILIGDNDFPVFMLISENLDSGEFSVEWKSIYPPKFLTVV